mmetsp:Transcript_5858/g.12161  ORF Transcript_5858/g.12161 Transcript_5858/m.12161 type:complete len:131 (+) Transcript_5858:1910-2302(+)
MVLKRTGSGECSGVCLPGFLNLRKVEPLGLPSATVSASKFACPTEALATLGDIGTDLFFPKDPIDFDGFEFAAFGTFNNIWSPASDEASGPNDWRGFWSSCVPTPTFVIDDRGIVGLKGFSGIDDPTIGV